MMLSPSAIVATAMNWACISVGKPGYSIVMRLTGLSSFGGCMVMVSSPISNVHPIDSSLSIDVLIC